MPDLRRLQDDALAAISAGDWPAAAGLYTALEKAAPGEGTWSLKLAECLRKLGRQEDAVKALGRALQVYSRAKMRSKATAVCRLILEITERTPLDELIDLRSRIKALRTLGYRLAIDDVGAGHAGVASLAQLEPDLVKLDMSLIRGIDHDSVKQDLVRSMLHVCRDMNIQVICEGVETAHERDALVQMGADLMQGYLFAKPGPPFPSVDLSTLARRK